MLPPAERARMVREVARVTLKYVRFTEDEADGSFELSGLEAVQAAAANYLEASLWSERS